MGSALGAGGGADMLQDVLRRKILEQQQIQQAQQFQQKLAEEARQSNQRNDVERGTLALGNRRTDEDARQFNEQAPVRMAGVQHSNASTEALNREPAEAEKARTFSAGESEKGRTFQGGQGDLNRGNAVRIAGIQGQTARDVAGVNHPGAPTGQQQNEVQDALDLIKQIRDDKSRTTATGPIDAMGLGKLRDLEGVTRMQKLHANLVGKMSLAQAGKLKGQGQISDKERQLLKDAATALDLHLGDADYEKELGKVEQQFQRMLPGPRAGGAPAPAGGGGFRVVEIK